MWLVTIGGRRYSRECGFQKLDVPKIVSGVKIQ
jgi:hypothetical protein